MAFSHSSAAFMRAAKRTVYIQEDNQPLANYIADKLDPRYALRFFTEGEAMLKALQAAPAPDAIVMAWENAEKSAPLLSKTLSRADASVVFVASSSANVDELSLATRLGASGLLRKPYSAEDIEEAIERQFQPVASSVKGSEEPVETPLGDNTSFVRSSKRMREIETQVGLVARSDIPVLILGESGTGKEVLAKFTHAMSNRASKMFLKVNCAAMPTELLESELFGYEQGAFTGAVKTKPGKFEICNGGTIFLDEIGEMPALLQAKLLHVLQDGTFSRLGSRAPMKADVRVIAATNIDMKTAIAEKTFRQDLYYRLNGFSFTLPPLRERREEVSTFAKFFMQKSASRYGRDPLPISSTLMTALIQYPWPGNLRELENVISRFLVIGDEQAIVSELSARQPTVSTAAIGDTSSSLGLKQLVRSLKGDAEAAAIASALEETKWNRKAAASKMKISYKALLYKIKEYELTEKKI